MAGWKVYTYHNKREEEKSKMRTLTKKLDGNRIVTTRPAEDSRYCRVYLLDATGKVLDNDGPWPNGISKEKHREMIDRYAAK